MLDHDIYRLVERGVGGTCYAGSHWHRSATNDALMAMFFILLGMFRNEGVASMF